MTEPILRPRRAAFAGLCCVLVALPFLVVQYPPITDLPQHVAQVRLFFETLGDAQAPYRIQWFTPYSMAYLPLGAAWALLPAEDVGRIGVLLIAVASTLAVHLLAARRARPVAAAVLASALVFSHVLYWGFLSFAIGWVAFVAWFLVTTSRPGDSFSARDAALLCGTALVLYVSHALWFAVGMAWLAVHALLARLSLRGWLVRVASVAPVGLAAALWYPHLEAAGFVSPTVWSVTPLERLSPFWLADAVLGGMRGVAEPVLLLFVGGWAAASLAGRDKPLRESVDVELLALALMLAVMGLLLPYRYMNTIQFAERWLPPAAIALVLALPVPELRGGSARWATLAVLAAFCAATAWSWARFERDEMSGFHQALADLPAGRRVIGLDYVKDSSIIKGRPFLQSFAYAQVERGARLSFSFAGFAPSLVVYRERPRRPWTPHLEWFAEHLRRSDLQYFDYAILNGDERVHQAFSDQPELQARTHTGRWRLYRVNPELAANPAVVATGAIR